MKNVIVIRGHGSISSLGHDEETIFESYRSETPRFQLLENTPVACLSKSSATLLERLIVDNRTYKNLDWSVLMAIYASSKAVENAGWQEHRKVSVNIGSSRGATSRWEKHIAEFQQTGKVAINTSPLTTLGNLSSWVAQHLNITGPTISHSVTCSTGIQAIANGFAWLRSGMADRFLAGATEAPLTPFTIAQIKALGIYATKADTLYPCRPLNSEKENTFTLGEGASVFALENVHEKTLQNEASPSVIIQSIGFGFENISSKTGISRAGLNFQIAIKNAIEHSDSSPIDLVIMHAPGTVAGDTAELNALNVIFKTGAMPILSSAKWMTGHTLGASACLGIDYALYILKSQSFLNFPYPTCITQSPTIKPINKILITAAGFGGNAAAVIVSNYVTAH